MDINTAEKARDFLLDIEVLTDIKGKIEEEYDNWWSFLTPNLKRRDSDGLIMPEILREEFTKAVDRSIEQFKKQIEEL